MRSKFKNMVLTGIFCGGLAAVFGLNLFLPDRDFSEQENRMLAQRPIVSFEDIKSGQYTQDAEAYLTDQFVGRDTWLGVKWLADRAIGKKESNGVYAGKEQTLIPALNEVDSRRKAVNTKAVRQLAENLKTPMYFAIIPSAAEIWREKLPYGAPGIDQKATIDALYQSVSGAAACVDLYEALHTKKEEPVFYRTDHHWTTLGAYYGYEAIAKALGIPPRRMDAGQPAQTGETVELQTVSENFYGTSQSKSGVRFIKPDAVQIWKQADGTVQINSGSGLHAARLYDWESLKEKDQYQVFFGGNQPQMILSNEKAADSRKLLVIKDSYANSMLPFLMGDFQEIHVLDMRFMKKSISEYAKQNDIDMTLVIYGLPNFLTDPHIGVFM